MTQYRTLNPLGSMAPKDLFDNAQNLDNWSNGEEPFYEDRFGVMRRSFSGMNFEFEAAQTGRNAAFDSSQANKESRFQAFLVSSGYVSKGDYAASVVLDERNEYVAVSATTTGTTAGLYRPGPGATLPLALTGTWATDSANLVLLGDDVLRQEIASSTGAEMIGYRQRTQSQKNDERASAEDFPSLADAFQFAAATGNRIRFSVDTTVLIPSQCPDLDLGVRKVDCAPGVTVRLRIQAGHQLTKGAIAANGDYSGIWIESEDAEVSLSEGFVGSSDVGYVDNPSNNIFLLGINCTMPVLNCLINANGRCSHGYYANNSRGRVSRSCGVKNAGRIGLYAVTSHVYANGTVWTGAGQEMADGFQCGIWATNGSIVTAQDSTDVSNSTFIGAGTSRASFLNVQRLITSGCRYGIEARRGFIDARYAVLDNCIERAINAVDAVTVNASQSSMLGVVTAVRVSGGAIVNVTGAVSDLGSPGLGNMSTVSMDLVRPLRAFNMIDGGTIVNNNAPPPGPTSVSKTSNTAYTSTSFVTDAHLFVGVRAGDTWTLEADLLVSVDESTTLALSIGGPSASSVSARAAVMSTSGNTFPTSIGSFDTPLVSIAGPQTAMVRISARATFTNNGVFTIRGARTIGAGAATILSASSISAVRVV